MKNTFLLLCVLFSGTMMAQEKETVKVPSHVKYEYCEPAVYEAAKELTLNELVKNDPTYKLVSDNFFIGPVLWKRYAKIKSISAIEGGNVKMQVDKKTLDGKYIQSPEDGKIIWDQMRSEFNGVPMRLRKATHDELVYYWAVISFDIVEPVIIAELPDHKFILDLDPETMELDWLDEVPQNIGKFLKGLK